MSAKDVKIMVLSRKTECRIDVKKKKDNLVTKELLRCSDEYCVLLNRKTIFSVLETKNSNFIGKQSLWCWPIVSFEIWCLDIGMYVSGILQINIEQYNVRGGVGKFVFRWFSMWCNASGLKINLKYFNTNPLHLWTLQLELSFHYHRPFLHLHY